MSARTNLTRLYQNVWTVILLSEELTVHDGLNRMTNPAVPSHSARDSRMIFSSDYTKTAILKICKTEKEATNLS